MYIYHTTKIIYNRHSISMTNAAIVLILSEVQKRNFEHLSTIHQAVILRGNGLQSCAE